MDCRTLGRGLGVLQVRIDSFRFDPGGRRCCQIYIPSLTALLLPIRVEVRIGKSEKYWPNRAAAQIHGEWPTSLSGRRQPVFEAQKRALKRIPGKRCECDTQYPQGQGSREGHESRTGVALERG